MSRPSAGLDQTVVDLVAPWIRDIPAAVAVRDDRRSLSYAELAAASRRVAGRLRERRLPPESRVGVLVERSADLPSILLGVARAGLAAVPLDPTHPAERLSYVLRDAGVRVLIADREPATDRTTVLAAGELTAGDADRDQCRDWDCDDGAGPAPDQLACVLYTSGSTGRPKGVGVTHRGIANNLRATRRLMGYRAGQRLLAVSTVSFDIAMLELFLPLVSGGETLVASHVQARDGGALREALARWRPDYLQATPVTWRMLLAAGWPGSSGLVIACGGDLVDPALAARLRACTNGFWHTYGPTEASLYAVCQPLDPGPQPAPLPIGYPIDNVWVRIVDEQLRPAAAGVIGELCIGGAGVARGYLGQPGLTAARFVPDPLAPGERMYRTGDLVRRLPDGRLELHGRADRQVKIRGHRIEPGEIEQVLAEHPEVTLAAVEVVGAGDDRKIIAYLQPAAADHRQLAAGIAGYARGRLPAHLVPAAFGVVDRMPVNANGKVDRQALAALRPPATRGARRLASDPARARMQRLCADTLGAQVAATEDFFEAGLLDAGLRDAAVPQDRAAWLVAAVNREFDVDLPAGAAYLAPSVDELLARVRWAGARRRLGRAGPAVRWCRVGDQLRHPPLVVAGAELRYRELVAALEPERPVGFAAAGGKGPPDRYLADLLGLPDPRRLILAGHGADAARAIAIARGLDERAGVRPALLLVDGPVPPSLAGYRGAVLYVTADGSGDGGSDGAGLAAWLTVAAVPVPRTGLLAGVGARRLAGLVAGLG